jgi:hypothetical protein
VGTETSGKVEKSAPLTSGQPLTPSSVIFTAKTARKVLSPGPVASAPAACAWHRVGGRTGCCGGFLRCSPYKHETASRRQLQLRSAAAVVFCFSYRHRCRILGDHWRAGKNVTPLGQWRDRKSVALGKAVKPGRLLLRSSLCSSSSSRSKKEGKQILTSIWRLTRPRRRGGCVGG